MVSTIGKPKQHRDSSYGFYLLDTEGNQLECIFIPHAPMPSRTDSNRVAILFGHVSTELLSKMKRHAPGLSCAIAYPEPATPTLAQTVDQLALSGIAEFLILPVFMASEAHVSSMLPELVDECAKRYPKVRFRITPALGETRTTQDALVASAIEIIY